MLKKLKTSREAHGDAPGADRISNLPAQVIDLILSYLPVRDIVRTSILSTDWRYRWVTVPNLVFGDGRILSITESKALASIIDHVLLLHVGSIEVFKIEGIGAIPEIDRWVLYLCQRSIKELVLEFCSCDSCQQYELPSCLCHCESLVELKLSDCLLTLPPCFDGFKSLKCLCLEDVTLAEDALEKLISSCPLLEELTLIDFEQNYHLKIDARNMRCLDIRGTFCNITFGHAMERLVVFSFEQLTIIDAGLEISLTEILTNLPGIQRFAVKDESLFCLSSGLTPESVPIQCNDLYHLSISMGLCWQEECFAAHYLFRCSPNLTELEIVVSPSLPDLGLWGDSSKCNWEFRKLRWVKIEIYNIRDRGGELKFIQFLLASSPVLERMILIRRVNSYISGNRVKQLCEFKRASAEAKIIFDGHLI